MRTPAFRVAVAGDRNRAARPDVSDMRGAVCGFRRVRFVGIVGVSPEEMLIFACAEDG